MEILTLTSPIVPPSITTWRVSYLALNWDGESITVGLRGSNGETKNHSYSGATAISLMTALNKANLSTISLHRRIINQLVTDGVILGTVSGSPD